MDALSSGLRWINCNESAPFLVNQQDPAQKALAKKALAKNVPAQNAPANNFGGASFGLEL